MCRSNLIVIALPLTDLSSSFHNYFRVFREDAYQIASSAAPKISNFSAFRFHVSLKRRSNWNSKFFFFPLFCQAFNRSLFDYPYKILLTKLLPLEWSILMNSKRINWVRSINLVKYVPGNYTRSYSFFFFFFVQNRQNRKSFYLIFNKSVNGGRDFLRLPSFRPSPSPSPSSPSL